MAADHPLANLVEVADASGIHLSEEPTNETGWRRLLADPDGTLAPPVEALLGSYMRLEARHRLLQRREEALQAALDRLPLGLIILEGTRVLVLNARAGRAIDGESLSWGKRRQLTWTDPAVETRYRKALNTVRRDDSALEAFRVERAGGVLLAMLTAAGEAWPGAVFLVLGDPEHSVVPNAEVFRAHYSLTPTEARVAALLAMGMTAREIAECHRVGVETTRTHVKHILTKVGCRRQVDAVRRLVSGPILLA